MNTSSPRASAATPRGRTLPVGVLLVGAALAVAAAFGTLWFVRVGVAIAVTAGVLALLLAVRAGAAALRDQRRVQADTVRAQLASHREEVRRERADTVTVLDTLQARFVAQRQQVVVLEHRVSTLREQLTSLRRQIGGLLPEVASLRGDKAAMADEIARRDTELAGLRGQLARLEEELAQPDEGEVLAMPRRSASSPLPTAEQIWGDSSHPTVVDLRAVTAESPVVGRRQA